MKTTSLSASGGHETFQLWTRKCSSHSMNKMKTDICALLVSISVFFITLAEAKQTKEKNCYRLNPPKNGSFQQIDFFEDQAFTKPLELQLRSDGLFDGENWKWFWRLDLHALWK